MERANPCHDEETPTTTAASRQQRHSEIRRDGDSCRPRTTCCRALAFCPLACSLVCNEGRNAFASGSSRRQRVRVSAPGYFPPFLKKPKHTPPPHPPPLPLLAVAARLSPAAVYLILLFYYFDSLNISPPV